MARKFFNQKVYNRKRKDMIQLSVILVSVIGIVLSLFLISYFKSKPKKEIYVKIHDQISLEINAEKPDEMIFFKELKGVKEKDLKVDYSKVEFDKLGSYKVKIKIKNKNYNSKINIEDYTAPKLTLKNVKIEKGNKYKAEDFVEKCIDNSKEECIISFYKEAIDSRGKLIDYESYSKPGNYEIKVIAKDSSDNETIKVAKLTIGDKPKKEEKPVLCEFGNLDYSNEHILANMIGSNGCAVDINLYHDEGIRNNINNIANSETKKLQMELNKLPNLPENITINRLVNAVLNNEGTGFVGYSLFIEAKGSENKNIVSFYLTLDGERHYIDNPYKLK